MADVEAVLFWQQNWEEAPSCSLSVEWSHQHDPCKGLCRHSAAGGLRKKIFCVREDPASAAAPSESSS